MTDGCTCPIYYQGVVSVEKGSVIIRYKLGELNKNLHCDSRDYTYALRQPYFKHARRVYLSDVSFLPLLQDMHVV